MKKHLFITLIAVVCAGMAGWAAPKQNILTMKQSITDNDIVFPESFETDTHEMMKNWYLQNYTVLDADVENKNAGEVSEEEYIKRLKAIPSVIEMPYNQVVRSYIDRYVKRNRTLVEEMLGMSLYYMPIFEQALEKEGLPLELKYLPVIESALNPNAVSRAGAAGLWQFMVGTGKGLGLEVNSLVDERRDPYRSSEKAAIYLKNLYSIYNDWSLAIAAYNCGPGNVNKALQRASGEGKDFWDIYGYLPRETRGYVPAFIAANYIMTYFKRHNISPGMARKPLITDTVSVTRRVNFNQIAHVLNMPIEEIRVLNPQYRHDVIPGDSRPYTLTLPSQQVYSYILSEDSIVAYRTDLYAHRDVVEPKGASANSGKGTYTYETKTVTQHHKVRRGETAASIASRYGMSTKGLLSMNGIKGGKLKRGQVLKVQTKKQVRVYHEPAPSENDYEGIVNVTPTDTVNSELAGQELEKAEIEEVHSIEQAAAAAPKRNAQRAEAAGQSQEAVAQANDTKADSRQWKQRNERYSQPQRGSKGNSNSQEQTYKNSRSSKRGTAREQQNSTHTVQKGESLSKIAEKNGVSVEALRKANGLSGDKIKAGDNLTIPSKNGTSTRASSSSKRSNGSKATSRSSSSKGSSSSKSKSKKRRR